MAIDEISTVKYRIYLLAIKYQIDLFCAIPELSYLTVPDVPGSDKCRRYHLFYIYFYDEDTMVTFVTFLVCISLRSRDLHSFSSLCGMGIFEP